MRYYLKRVMLALAVVAATLYAVSALTSSPVEPHPYFAQGGFLVMAHRGGKGLAPENTLAAFAHAQTLGVDVLELDLRLSADGIPIVLHDRRVDRTTDGRGRADSLSLAELKTLDAGYHFSPDGHSHPHRGQGVTVPTLDEVFTTFPDMRFLIEIKDDSDALAQAFCHTVERFQLQQRVVAASFRDGPLETFRRACPDVAVSMPSGAVMPYALMHWLRLDAAYRPEHQALQLPPRLGSVELIDRRFVERAHAHNIQVHAWTINDPEQMRHLIDLGVDGLITDYPDRLLDLLNRPPGKEPR